jgi:hypothetical protein
VNERAQPGEERKSAHVPKNILQLMLGIVIVLAAVTLYANVQRWRRNKIETVLFTPTEAPSSSGPASSTAAPLPSTTR